MGVITTIFFAWQFGFLSIATKYDESYFTLLISALYAIFETMCGIKIYKLSKSIIQAKKHLFRMKQMQNLKIVQKDDKVFYGNGQEDFEIKESNLSNHILDLLYKKSNMETGKLNNKILINNVSSELVDEHILAFIFMEVLIWLGLIGTILGIILTFYPFISGTIIINAGNVQQTLSVIFKGVGSAFFPSIVSAICSLYLKGSDYFLVKGSNELISVISRGSDIIVSPVVDKS
jgi:uncharacterized membrane protein YecN with MAPEG domain